MTKERTQEVVILGGGYAGLMAAVRLANRRVPARVTLVDAKAEFPERIRLHQVAAGQQLRRRSIPELLRGTGVEFIQGRASELDPEAQLVAVQTRDGQRTLRYDWLLYALGSQVDLSPIPGLRQHTVALDDRSTAKDLAARLERLGDGRVLIVGGGLTGIEAAVELAERFPRLAIELATAGALGEDLSPAGAAHIRRVFDWHGIALREHARIEEIQEGVARLAGGERIPFDICLWAGGFRAPGLAARAGLPTNERGQVIVDRTLQVPGHPEILVAGDAALAPGPGGKPLRMSCAAGQPMGAHAGDTLARLIRGQEPEPFRFSYILRCISLGRHDGLIQFVASDDTPRDRVLTGRAAAVVKEAICRYTLTSVEAERRLRLPLYWWLRPAETASYALPAGAGTGVTTDV